MQSKPITYRQLEYNNLHHIKLTIKIFTCLFLIAGITFANASTLINEAPSYDLVDHLSWRYANDNEDTLSQIQANTQANWLKSPDNALSLGLINATVLVKFELLVTEQATSEDYVLELSNATLSKSTLFQIQPNSNEEVFAPIGMATPFENDRFMSSPNNHFKIDLSQKGKHQFYLKIEHNGYFDLPLVLQTPQTAFNEQIDKNFYINIFYGFFIALTLYHLFYFFIIRDPIYLSYLFFTTGIALLFGYIDGLLFKHIWPNFPSLNAIAVKISIPLVSISITLLCFRFLGISKANNGFNKLIKSILGINILSLLIALLLNFNLAILTSLSILFITFIFITIISFLYFFLYRTAVSLVFLVSTAFFMVTCSIISVGLTGLIPFNINNLWDTLKLAVSMQMLIFASAIAYRVKIINRERRIAIIDNNTKSEMIARVSHELRTPLNGILGLSHLMDPMLNGTTKSYNHMIHQSATALLTVINDLLDVSRINAGKFSINKTPTQIHDLINSTAKSLFSQLDTKLITAKVNIDPLIPEFVLADPDRLRQLMSNLLGNSIKFTETGSIQLDVRKIEHVSDMYRFKIIDTGPGIKEDDIARIFNPYEQANSHTLQSQTSTGLGLFITQQLAKAMDTKIKVDSTVGEGSTFWFDLKLVPSEKSTQKSPPKPLYQKPLQILVAEDNNINQLIIKKILENFGHEITMNKNGKEALESMKTQHFDLVLMDCDMPILDGYEAAKQFREFEKQSSKKPLPIYALTAHAYHGHEKKVLESGMNAQLLKPIKPDEIANLLHSLTKTNNVNNQLSS